eukprot:TRINITY_DN1052_c0_g3_i4.p1 TRINITY_DN1052_c0_g3~~TRINITY_DN1052_c0_g3_i4.p1  ORF type:complete len:110 (-),score=15.63 TRINITY_DN1052_c0_g3_i4:121-450(-)
MKQKVQYKKTINCKKVQKKIKAREERKERTTLWKRLNDKWLWCQLTKGASLSCNVNYGVVLQSAKLLEQSQVVNISPKLLFWISCSEFVLQLSQFAHFGFVEVSEVDLF